MWEDWRLPVTLWHGTRGMRQAGRYYLPQEPAETDEAYDIRLKRTYLYNAYRRSIQSLAGQPFIKPVTVHNLPEELSYIERDADGMGNSLTEVAHNLLVDGLHFGKYHVLVDYPSVDGVITLKDSREKNIRPYFNIISPLYLIGWDSERVGGVDLLHDVRIKEVTVETLDVFENVLVTRVRMYNPTSVVTYMTTERQTDYDEESVSENTLGYVPLVTGYVERTGFMTSRPPLEDLAWMNLRHWQSSSDQNNILHVARVPMMFFRGFGEDEMNMTIIGPNRAVSTSSETADIKFIEHSGAAIQSGERDLEKIELQMERMGSDILAQRSVARQTATARQIDKSESLSVMQIAVRELEHSLEEAIRIAGEWIGVDTSDVEVQIGEDLGIAANEPNPIESLESLGLSDEDLLHELQRRGILSSSVKSVSPMVVNTDSAEKTEEEEAPVEAEVRFYPNGEEIDARLPEAYREAKGETKQCRNCKFYDDELYICSKFDDAPVRPNWVCAAWEDMDAD